jgi:hypothetical protein
MLDFLTPQSLPEHTLTSKEEMAIGALGSTPGFFSALSQVLHRSFPPFFDASRPCPTFSPLAGKPTAGACGCSRSWWFTSTGMLVQVLLRVPGNQLASAWSAGVEPA